ncbi:MAG: PilZ domain-containing protein [Pseudomonadales bacterium]|nr:PilZ domain-containing protein [Pseudomonadales bacterium]MDG1661983.1 PilZ domain-containing protein [Pseudomonadales bacterium]MDG2079596.1 PilZ domain-containing protein [Pseudomonadales bacterium]
MNYSEQRNSARIPTEARLEIHHAALGVLKLKATNASSGGFFAIRGASDLPPAGTIVDVYIKRYAGALHRQPAPMRVVYVNNKGMGLEFV